MYNFLLFTYIMANNTLPITNGRVNLTSTAGAAVYAGTLPAPIADPNGREGWLYTKTGGAEKLNYFFYAQGALPVTLNSLENVFFVATVDNWTDSKNVPFIVVYTKPLFDGQDGGAWYRTKRTFSIPNNVQLTVGMATQFSMVNSPTPRFPFEQITLSSSTVVGPNLLNEELLTISVHTDSSAANDISVLISYLGWKERGGHITNPNFLLSGS